MPFYARSLGRSVGRSIGRLVSFHFLSLRAHSTAQHGTARHGTHNLQIQTNRTLDTIEQTGLEQKQPAKLRTAPKLTLFPSSSLSNALLPKGKAAFSHCILGNSVKICAGNRCPANGRFFFKSSRRKKFGNKFYEIRFLFRRNKRTYTWLPARDFSRFAKLDRNVSKRRPNLL